MDQQSTRTDITVNVDGFWMLQALLDIRHVAPGVAVPAIRIYRLERLAERTPWHGGDARAGHCRRQWRRKRSE